MAIHHQNELVVLGAGHAGIQTSHFLLRHVISSLPNPETYHVTLVDPSTKWVSKPAAPRALASEKLMPTDKWILEIKDGFKEYKPEQISIVQAKAVALDTTGRRVTLQKDDGATQALKYYALIVATGARSISPLYSAPFEHTVVLKAQEVFHQALSEAKSIVIAGGGPTGVETAGELGDVLNGKAGWFKSNNVKPKTKITLIASENRLLPVLRESLGKKAEDLLKKLGVEVIYNCKVTNTVPELAGQLGEKNGVENVAAATTITLSNGKVLEADLYIPAYGLRPNSSWLPEKLRDERGYIKVNRETLRVDDAGPRVYAVGEIGKYGSGGLIELGSALPVVFVNIKRDLIREANILASGGKEKVPIIGKDNLFVSKPHGNQMVVIGQSYGVGELFGWNVPSFFVWLIKGTSYMTFFNPMNLKGFQASDPKWKDY